MKIDKKFFLLLLAITALMPSVASADTTLLGLVEGAKASLMALGGGLATIAFIVAGIMFLTATGNPSRMEIGKKALLAAVIGIVIIVLAGGAELFVKGFFGMTGDPFS